MKRFTWPLQRLLDVTAQRELALRAELFAFARRIAQQRQQIVHRRSVLDGMLEALGRDASAERLTRQELFMRYAETARQEIDSLNMQLESLRKQRRQKTAEFSKIRSSRKALERLREQARRRWRRDYMRFEQKVTDENANLAYARQRARSRTAALG
ncbi:MAG: hypothetical protein KGY99_04920 [Phycisphaerae bacterium]|nr:hypothetical protein [Phycisphaerae bacterium]